MRRSVLSAIETADVCLVRESASAANLRLDPGVEAAAQCLKETGAIRPCSRCGEGFLLAADETAEQRAYERAAHLWKAGLRGFAGMSGREVAGAVGSVLATTPKSCPECR